VGRRALAGLAVLAGWAAGACLVRGAPPQPAPSADTHETRRRTRPDGSTESEVVVRVSPYGRVERDGFEREFHPDGRLAAERFFAREVATGVWRTWYPDGTLRSESDFGPPGSHDLHASRYWHPGGQLAAQGSQRGGVRQGAWVYYSPEGGTLRAGSYLDGQRDGPWVFYDARGRKEAEGLYERGARVGRWTLWDEQGQPHLRPGEEAGVDEPPQELFHAPR